jgi:hypothetical protein
MKPASALDGTVVVVVVDRPAGGAAGWQAARSPALPRSTAVPRATLRRLPLGRSAGLMDWILRGNTTTEP